MTLKELLEKMGVDAEKIAAIESGMKEHNLFITSEEDLDIRFGKLKGDFEELTKQHGESTKLIEQLKNSAKDDSETQQKIGDYETQIAALQKELHDTKVTAAAAAALQAAGATDTEYALFKLRAGGELELGEDGKIKGIGDMIAGLKTQYPQHFGGGAEQSAGNRNIDPFPLPKGEERQLEPRSLAEALEQKFTNETA